jgi:hypothetical protein
MADVRYIDRASWEDFTASLRPDFFPDQQFMRGRYLFRGLPSHDFQLVSSFDRLFPSTTDRRRLSKAILDAFREECRGEVPEEILARDDLVLALGQHYGLPTRLLDWSDSPYVAAFFALDGALPYRADPTHHVAVWVLHLDAGIWTDEVGVQVVDVPSIPDMRIRNQFGRFTLARTPARTLEEYAKQADSDGVALTQIYFPASEASKGLADLAMMGLSASRLFPDLTGAAAAAKTRVVLESLPSTRPEGRFAHGRS